MRPTPSELLLKSYTSDYQQMLQVACDCAKGKSTRVLQDSNPIYANKDAMQAMGLMSSVPEYHQAISINSELFASFSGD